MTVRAAMVHVDAGEAPTARSASERVVLRKEKIPGLVSRTGGGVRDLPILAAAEINGHFVVMFTDRISVFSSAGTAGRSRTPLRWIRSYLAILEVF